MQHIECQPAWSTPRTPDRKTLGHAVAKVAEAMGKPLIPWQRDVLDVALEIDNDTGLLAYREVVLVVGRQQGKSELLWPTATHRTMAWEDQVVDFAAQTHNESRRKFEDRYLPTLSKWADKPKSPIAGQYRVRMKLGVEAVLWNNGSSFNIISTTGKTAGTGDSVDMPILDEGWSHSKDTERSIRPAMGTRKQPQLWVASMVRVHPVHKSLYLKNKMNAGRLRVQQGLNYGSCYIEFSADTKADPGDPATWYSCLPGLGILTPEAAIRDDYEAMDLQEFCSEYLSWWPEEGNLKWSLISKDVWEDLSDPQSEPVGDLVIGIEVNQARTAGAIGVCGRRDDRDWHLELIDYRPGTGWIEDRVIELIEFHKIPFVVIDAHSPASSYISPIKRKIEEKWLNCEVYTVQGPQVLAACGRFYDATGNGTQLEPGDPRVRHLGQHELDIAVSAATKHVIGSQFKIARSGTSVDISPLYAVVLAMLGHLDKVDGAGPSAEIFV